MKRTNAAVTRVLSNSMAPILVRAGSGNGHGAISGDIFLPEQFFTLPQQHWTGARRLALAVLQDAVACWFRYRRDHSTRGRRLFRETRDWFWSHDQSWPYTFECICAYLKLDPDAIRRGLVCQQDSRPKNLRIY